MSDELYIEERIGDEAVEKANRQAKISPYEFRTMYMRLQARIELDAEGEYVTLLTAGGRVVVRPSQDVEPDHIAWA